MKKYEAVIILRNNNLDALKTKVRSILEKNGAKITQEAPWGVKRLAYPIDGDREGYYDFMYLETDNDTVQKVIQEFRINSDILRYMFVALDPRKVA